MAFTTTVTSKGTITLPVSVRRSMNIKTGDRLVVDRRGQTITVKPDAYEEDLMVLRKKAHAHLKSKGLLGMPDEQIMDKANKVRAEEYKKKHDIRS